MKQFIGTGVALVTPFQNDFSVDVQALKRIVEYNIEGGVEYLVVLGTTAETATLTLEEQELVKQTVIDANAGRLPLVLGVGSNNTQQVLDSLTKENLKGFDAILSVSPYYNKPSQEGIYQHFKAIAQQSPLPIIIYNVPGRTSSNMMPNTVLRLAHEFKNIVGVKEASGNIVQAMEIIKDKPADFLVISGDDMVTLPMVLAGGSGVISVIGEAYPKQFSEMVRLGLQRKVDEAYKLHYSLTSSIDMIFEQGNPCGVKELFKGLGLCENTVRLPLVTVNEDLKNRLHQFANTYSK